MSLVRKEISDFTVQAYADEEFRGVKKSDILEKWAVFFFYPADSTSVCPTKLEDLVGKYEDSKSVDCEVYSVSCDSYFVHKAWHGVSKTTRKIKYPMLADPIGGLIKGFDAIIEANGMVEKGSFIVNPEGEIVAYEATAESMGRNTDELFRCVQVSRFMTEHSGRAYPAK